MQRKLGYGLLALGAGGWFVSGLVARTDAGAPAWILCLAAVVAYAAGSTFLCWTCCVVSGRIAQWREDNLGERRS